MIHGWQGNPEENWFPWLRAELEKRDVEVIVPALPNSNYPQINEWLDTIKIAVGDLPLQTIFVGHSLGVIAILRFLESLPEEKRIAGAVLVSGFAKSLGYPETENFFTHSVDLAAVKRRLGEALVINSDNDPYVPLDFGKSMADAIGAEFNVMKEAGHINAAAGFKQCQPVFDEVWKLVK